MASKLVIVESPTKARTLAKILGAGYIIKGSLGHVRDLPRGKLGIDIENGFAPTYVVPEDKQKTISDLSEAASTASAVYLATDPDREGEAISWHLVQAADLRKDKLAVHRVVFHEITKEAVQEAFRNPRPIDMNLVDAQQARRVLDRLVGYKLSPLLWRKVQKGLSAGRVQSAAVRIIVDREREIQNFAATEYWTIEAELTRSSPGTHKTSFRALLVGLSDGTKWELPTEDEAERLKNELNNADYTVGMVEVKETSRQPAPPFTTSTLQQEAWRKLHFTGKRTMRIAQQLYEGVSIGDEGSVGLITYMRTDSTRVAASALTEAREYIASKYGNQFLPPRPRYFAKKAKWAQEAHEAIRPTSIYREPDKLRSYLDAQQMKLYDLIWKRMVASQMAPALSDTTTVKVHAKCVESKREYLLKATSSVLKFPGFVSVYRESKDEEEDEDNKPTPLPELKQGDKLVLVGLFPEQHFTQPPPRYTEATLIKTLEQKGIGRPSTYAPIISTIQERGYILQDQGKLHPDQIGFVVNDLLIQHFPTIVDLGFTAQLEESLDDISQGKKEQVSVLGDFYTPFEETLRRASEGIEKIKVEEPTDETCPDCGRPMVIKMGRYGKFLSCSGYPDCKKTMPFLIKLGIRCPKCQEGELVEKMSRKKRRFYGCSRYPACDFGTGRKPFPEPCPQCGNLLTLQGRGMVKCTACEYKGKVADFDKVGAAV